MASAAERCRCPPRILKSAAKPGDHQSQQHWRIANDRARVRCLFRLIEIRGLRIELAPDPDNLPADDFLPDRSAACRP